MGGPLVVGAGMFVAVRSVGWSSQHFEQWLNQLVFGKPWSFMHAVVSLPDSDTEKDEVLVRNTDEQRIC